MYKPAGTIPFLGDNTLWYKKTLHLIAAFQLNNELRKKTYLAIKVIAESFACNTSKRVVYIRSK